MNEISGNHFNALPLPANNIFPFSFVFRIFHLGVWRVAAHFHQHHLQSFLHVLNVSSLWFPSRILSLPTSHWPLWSFNFYPSPTVLPTLRFILSIYICFILSDPSLHLCFSLVSPLPALFLKHSLFPSHSLHFLPPRSFLALFKSIIRSSSLLTRN